MAYRVLILIDHSTHNDTNSLYPLSRAFYNHPKVSEVFVASRAAAANLAFFTNLNSPKLWAVPVDGSFSFDPSGKQFDGSSEVQYLQTFDLILLRLPHPVSDHFFHFISRQVKSHRIINRPDGLIRTGSKKFLLELRDICPPMRWCTTLDDILDFHRNFDLVLKPAHNYGGKGLFRIYQGRLEDHRGYICDLTQARPYLSELGRSGYLAMKFLKNVHLGDKRIVVVNGTIVGAALRSPADGSWLCNVSQGGTATAADVDDREVEIIRIVEEKVRPLGIGIFGADTLVDDSGVRVLSEINTFSVGGFGPMEVQQQKPIAKIVADELINFFEETNT